MNTKEQLPVTLESPQNSLHPFKDGIYYRVSQFWKSLYKVKELNGIIAFTHRKSSQINVSYWHGTFALHVSLRYYIINY